MLRVFEHKSMGRAGIEPDVENVIDLLPGIVGELAEEPLARARRIPGIGAFFVECFYDTQVDLRVIEDFD
jgi:hypothetical protein